MTRYYYVYIMMGRNGNVLYVGVTNNLTRRVFEHKQGQVKGFTEKFNCKKLVYYDSGQDINGAIAREKQIKKWNRDKKLCLIKKFNPLFDDLGEKLESL